MKNKYYSHCIILFFLGLMSFAQSQKIEIKGMVLNNEGLPLTGASVLVKGTTNGTQTDFDGNFTITANQNDLLVISYLGFTTKEIPVASNLSITLFEDTNALEEVVITSLGIKKEKKALGYAVTTLDGDELENKPESDVARALLGKVAGVQINVNTGSTGDQVDIRIRGNSSLTNGNSPLIVVDNVPYNGNLININPNDIKDFSVLKGLNASLLYGTDGRNGVILITTKSGSGRKGGERLTVDISQSVYTNQVANLPEYQNTYGQGGNQDFNGGFLGSWGPAFTDLDFVPHPYADNTAFPEFANVLVPYEASPNNVENFFNTGIGTVTAINIASSQEKTSFNLSAGYTDETGIIGNNDMKRFNLGVGGSVQLTDKLDVSATLQYSRRKRNSQSGSDIFDILLYIPRNIDVYNLPYEDPVTNENVYYRADANPNWAINNTGRNDDVVRLFTTINTKYVINDNLTLNYRIGLDNFSQDEFDFANMGGANDEDDNPGFLILDYDRTETIDQTLILNASYKLNDKIGLDGQIGANSRTSNYKYNYGEYRDQVVFDFFRPSNFDSQVGSAGRNRENIAGAFGQLEFNYDRFLYVTISGRNDWSSTLEKENQSLFYPGASISFIPSSAFSFDSKIVNYLKLRGAYATSGGFPGLYSTRSILDSDAIRFVGPDGEIRSNGSPSVLANPNLKPELHKEVEVGVESKLFNNRISLEASVYRRISEDQIVTRSLDRSTGYGSVETNIGRIDNEGLEIDMSIDIIKNKDFNWNLRNIFTTYTTTVVELDAPIDLSSDSNNDSFAIEGQPFGVLFEDYALRDSEGNFLINPTNGELLVSDDLGLPDKVIGDPTPDWTLTSITGIRYKNFLLSAQLEYTHGGDIASRTAVSLLERGVTRDTENREGTFIIPGVYGDPSTGLPLLDENGQTIPNTVQASGNDTAFSNFYAANDNRIFDASVFRVREVALSYNLDGNKHNLPFKSIVFSLSGRNIFYNAPNYPKYTNVDPEVDLGSTSVPTTKRYSFGVTFSF